MTHLPLDQRARTARLRAGFERESDAAIAIGCSRPLVIRWESGDARSIGQKYLLSAARAYRVRPEWLAMETNDDGYPWRGREVAPDPPVAKLDPEAVEDVIAVLRDEARDEGRKYDDRHAREFVDYYNMLAALPAEAPTTRRGVLAMSRRLTHTAKGRDEHDTTADAGDDGARSQTPTPHRK